MFWCGDLVFNFMFNVFIREDYFMFFGYCNSIDWKDIIGLKVSLERLKNYGILES